MDRKTPEDSLAVLKDAVLLERIQAGDQTALAEFYERHQRLVYSLALSILASSADAEEVTQEVFFRIWEKADIFDTQRGSALAWVATMTRRLAIDRTRSKHYRARTVSVEIGEAEIVQDGAEDAFRKLEWSEALEAVRTLSVDHRAVINLSFFESLSHSEIALRLDKPLGTIKSRIREAMVKLREQLL